MTILIELLFCGAVAGGLLWAQRVAARRRLNRNAVIDVATVNGRFIPQCSECGPMPVALVSAMKADELRLKHMKKHRHL